MIRVSKMLFCLSRSSASPSSPTYSSSAFITGAPSTDSLHSRRRAKYVLPSMKSAILCTAHARLMRSSFVTISRKGKKLEVIGNDCRISFRITLRRLSSGYARMPVMAHPDRFVGSRTSGGDLALWIVPNQCSLEGAL